MSATLQNIAVIEPDAVNSDAPITQLTRQLRGPIRPTVFTYKKQKKFLQALYATGGNIARACELARVSRPTVYAHKAANPDFNRLWEEAHDAAVESLEEEVYRRAKHGVDEPVFYQGDVVGHVKRYSDFLAGLVLKAHRPEKYRENIKVETELSPQSVDAVANSLAQALIKAAEARRMAQTTLTDGA